MSQFLPPMITLLQDYVLALGGTQEMLDVIGHTSNTDDEERIKLLQYCLDLDRALQGMIPI